MEVWYCKSCFAIPA